MAWKLRRRLPNRKDAPRISSGWDCDRLAGTCPKRSSRQTFTLHLQAGKPRLGQRRGFGGRGAELGRSGLSESSRSSSGKVQKEKPRRGRRGLSGPANDGRELPAFFQLLNCRSVPPELAATKRPFDYCRVSANAAGEAEGMASPLSSAPIAKLCQSFLQQHSCSFAGSCGPSRCGAKLAAGNGWVPWHQTDKSKPIGGTQNSALAPKQRKARQNHAATPVFTDCRARYRARAMVKFERQPLKASPSLLNSHGRDSTSRAFTPLERLWSPPFLKDRMPRLAMRFWDWVDMKERRLQCKSGC